MTTITTGAIAEETYTAPCVEPAAAAAPAGAGRRACPKCGARMLLAEPASLACVLCGWRASAPLASERPWFAARAEGAARRAAVGYTPDHADRRRLWRQWRIDVQRASITSREDFQSSAAAGRLRAILETEFEPTAWFRREVL